MDDLLAWAHRQQDYLLAQIDSMIAGQRSTFDETEGGPFDSTSRTLADLARQANELEIILSQIKSRHGEAT